MHAFRPCSCFSRAHSRRSAARAAGGPNASDRNDLEKGREVRHMLAMQRLALLVLAGLLAGLGGASGWGP